VTKLFCVCRGSDSKLASSLFKDKAKEKSSEIDYFDFSSK
jgi:hypothetical protein